jgi:hypothetical protein
MSNNVERFILGYRRFVESSLDVFCKKHGLEFEQFIDMDNEQVVCFSGDLLMLFRDVYLDLVLSIQSGIAVVYMQGEDVDLYDDYGKKMSYKEYLKFRKLI